MKRRPRRTWRSLHSARLSASVAVLLLLFVIGDGPHAGLSTAADVSQFNPGNIISDGMFFDGGAMSVADIDRFIQVKGLTCRVGSDGTPCLKDFHQSTTGHAADPDGYCGGYLGGVADTAAVIIGKVARACNISPRVLLVVLQKEQGLVTSTGGAALTSMKYQKAMGYACPDTAGCDTTYYGFENQVYYAARQFERYKANPTAYGYRLGRTSSVLYNPNTSCGSSQVYIQNQATAGLYNYTPYQPNAAALAAGYGSGNSCSSYGNRNFWLYFTDWFGSTQEAGQSAWQPIGHLDSVTAVTGDTIFVHGWAVDPDTSDAVTVHLYIDQVLAGVFPADTSRPDIGALLTAYGNNHGFDLSRTVTPGRHDVCAWGINTGLPAPDTWLGCQTVDTGGLPFGQVEQLVVDEGQALVTGWAIDPDLRAAGVEVRVYVNGQWIAYGPANLSRPDLVAAYPEYGAAHGFSFRTPLQPGDNQVCVYAINVGAGAFDPTLTCRILHLDVNPIGWLETATGSATSVTVTGWALDPETRFPIDVHAFVDGVDTATQTAGDPRPDIGREYPALGPGHGFSFTFAARPGVHTVCARARNVRQGPFDALLSCQTVNVGAAPIGHLDRVSVTAFQATVDGWALDPDTPAPVNIQIWVDGLHTDWLTANLDRPDVGARYPASGNAHGFHGSLPLSSGRHTVCAVAMNLLGGPESTPLNCAQVTVAGGQLPIGQLDNVRMEGSILRAGGWTVDPDAPTMAIPVVFLMDGARGYGIANESRPDVGVTYPGVGPSHGFTGSWVPTPGWHTVCAYGVNRVWGNADTLLGCRVIVVP